MICVCRWNITIRTVVALLTALTIGASASAQQATGGRGVVVGQPELSQSARRETLATEVGFDQKLNSQLPLDAKFTDQDGKAVSLGDFFGEKPVVVMPVYYECPMLCGLELNGLVRCLRAMDMSAGDEFNIVTFSIDPTEDASLASKKRRGYLTRYDRDSAETGWQFLTGTQEEITRVCEAIGFKAKYDPESKEYAHAAGIVVCTPDGRAARYFYGVEFSPRDLRLGVVEASENKIGTLTDHVLLYCYLYDPTQGKYGLAILKILRLAGILTVIVLGTFVFWALRRERRLRRAAAALALSTHAGMVALLCLGIAVSQESAPGATPRPQGWACRALPGATLLPSNPEAAHRHALPDVRACHPGNLLRTGLSSAGVSFREDNSVVSIS